MTTIVIDGALVVDLDAFIREVARVLSPDPEAPGYFGWELHSLQDVLYGGFLGTPPYDIVVEHGHRMVEAFGHQGYARYCDRMLEVISRGGRGLVLREHRSWYEQAAQEARRGEGVTLLDALVEIFVGAPASLVLLDDDGTVLLRSASSDERGSA